MIYPVGIDISNLFKRTNKEKTKLRHQEMERLHLEECRKTGKDIWEKYYTYIYLDPRYPGKYQFGAFVFSFAPFYVGKGTGERCFAHLYEQGNSQKHKTIRHIKQQLNRKPIIMKLNDNVSESIAFAVENELIKQIGQINRIKGCLTNKVAGHSKIEL